MTVPPSEIAWRCVHCGSPREDVNAPCHHAPPQENHGHWPPDGMVEVKPELIAGALPGYSVTESVTDHRTLTVLTLQAADLPDIVLTIEGGRWAALVITDA